jgi:AraC-like DNA-binding protein
MIALQSVERSIDMMRKGLAKSITIDDLARSAMFSKFHFSRLFLRVTGISPGRYLSAMRIEEAKRLLISTSLSIVDISYLVGYNSVGTFSSRFHRSVGLPPSAYRRRGGTAFDIRLLGSRTRHDKKTMVRGRIITQAIGTADVIFVGLFRGRMLEGAPIRFVVRDSVGPYELADVPEGTWHVLAHSVSADGSEPIALVGWNGPIEIRAGISARIADVELRRKRTVDPPVLTALLDGRSPTLGHPRQAQLAQAR